MLSPLPIPPAGEPLLSPTHQRVLSSLVLLLEDRLTALQALLGPHPPGIAQVWADDLSTAEHAGLTATAEAFRAELAALHATYRLDMQPRSPRHEVAFAPPSSGRFWAMRRPPSSAATGPYPQPWRPTGMPACSASLPWPTSC
jgi:hypothetical protein